MEEAAEAVAGPAESGDAALPEAATTEEALPPKGGAEEAPTGGGAEEGAAAEGPAGEPEGAADQPGEVPAEGAGKADEGPPGGTEGSDGESPVEAKESVGGAPGEAEGSVGEAPGEVEGSVGGAPEKAEAPPGEAEGAAEAAPAEGVTGEEDADVVRARVSFDEGMPTSADFDEGELSEPLHLQVGVPLGRNISESLWELEQQTARDRLEPGSSPDKRSDEESEEAERLAEEQRQRAELVEQYRQLVVERSRLCHFSTKLQSRLAEMLNKVKGKERPRGELEQHISDKEQRYSRYLSMLQELRSQQQEEMAWYQQQMDALQEACDKKRAKVDAQWKAFQAAKKEVAVYTMGRRLGGKQAAKHQVDQIQAREESKEKEMTEVRLENIKLKHRIYKLEASLKAQEELAEGLHLIDFEQLKIENQTYNEKIEERNEELLKLRRKITNTVQVLTQVKEKLQFVEAENQGQKGQLMAVEALVAHKRDILTKTKQARDRLRTDNEKLHQKCGLLGDRVLLRDYEEKVSVAEVLKERLEVLKRQHAGLALTCEGIKKKIRGIKSFLPI